MLRVQLGRGDQARRGRDEARPAEAAARARVFQRGTVQEPVEVTGQELSPCVQLPVCLCQSLGRNHASRLSLHHFLPTARF